MWRLRELYRSIKSLVVWFKIAWNDRQWDHSYYETILLHKIKLQRDYFTERQFFVGWENEVKWMNICIILLTRITNAEYWEDEWDNIKPSRNGLSENYQKLPEYVDSVLSKKESIYADIWEDKTRTLFWKIFVWRYERWWD